MRVADLAVELRPRTRVEIADLAFRLAAVWHEGLLRAFFVGWLPTLIVASIVAFQEPKLALLLVWWLRPLYGAVGVHVASRAFFRVPTTIAGIIRDGCWWRAWRSLTYGRFSPNRHLMEPLNLLEGRTRRVGRARRAAVRAVGGNDARALIGAFWCIELLLMIALAGSWRVIEANAGGGVFVGTGAWVPAAFDGNVLLFLFVLYAIVATLMEPVAAIAGFCLYLSLRNRGEGWDIELGFRAIAARIGRSVALTLLAVALVAAASAPVAAGVADDAGLGWTASNLSGELKRVEVAIGRVYDAPHYREERVRSEHRLRRPMRRPSTREPDDLNALDPQAPPPPRRATNARNPEPVRGETEAPAARDATARSGSSSGRGVVAWVVGAIIGLLVLATLVRALRSGLFAGGWRPWAPARSADVEVRDAEEPWRLEAGPADRALALWHAGAHRASIASLYEALVFDLRARGVRVADHWTEGDVLRAARRNAAGDVLRLVEDIVRVWMRVAYAHSLPEEHEVASLCDRWRRVAEQG